MSGLINDFFSDLRKRTSSDVRTDEHSRIVYSTDASIYQVMPLGVLIPKNMEDVQAAMELAARYKMPVLPRTAGSSLAGQAVNKALVIDFTRHLDKIIAFNPEERWVDVEPGVVLDILNNKLAPNGLKFGPDPASSNRAALGGIVSNNSTGSHSILYGMTADHLQEVDVFLSDGSHCNLKACTDTERAAKEKQQDLEGAIYRKVGNITRDGADAIRKGTPGHWRRCGGYNLDRFISGTKFVTARQPSFNLANLICGGEGSLAVLSKIRLGLVPLPRKSALALVQFDSLRAALEATPRILEVAPSAVELLDNYALTLCREKKQFNQMLHTFLSGTPNCILITEFYGTTESELKDKVESLKVHLKSSSRSSAVTAVFDPALQNNVWAIRKAGLGLVMSVKGDHKPLPFIEDAAVPVEHLADYVTEVEKFCNDLGTKVAYYAHASAGCIHIRPLINAKDATDIAKLKQISRFSVGLLGEYGGSFSSEHGDGRSRTWLNERFFGTDLYRLYKEVKTAFDPDNILNPGTIVDGPAMDVDLRYGANYKTIPVNEKYSFKDYGGFDKAVEMCNGAGICRKTTTGSMCPSFMATREEEHSTRGRANALRAALSGQLPQHIFQDEQLFEIMDLCVECKSCKSECPSSVDLARIKFEYLAHYYDNNPIPLRNYLFAHVAPLYKMLSGPQATLFNIGLRSKLFREFNESVLGISACRQMPPIARHNFLSWHRKRKNRSADTERPQVVLFHDTFSTYSEPNVAIAAFEVLEKAGFEVLLSNHGCCGRPAISKGMFKAARSYATKTFNRLIGFARQGLPIIGIEPSCLLTLRDEYLTIFPDNEEVKVLASHCFTIEEFLADVLAGKDIVLPLTSASRRILVHGHCHQKALSGTDSLLKILNQPENYSAEVIDSSCCGMAGTFGYEEEHYDISMKMGERVLFPQINHAAPETIIASSGSSCRHQITHATGKQVLHPVEVLHQAIK